jgi:hypothetical protein
MEIKLLEIISYRYFPESLSKSTIYIYLQIKVAIALKSRASLKF